MAECILKDGAVVSDYGEPYIIAEVNSSHGGNIETAKAMIDEAAKIGCDCVKFQSWSRTSLYSRTYYDRNKIASRVVEGLSMTEEQLRELALYCREREIAFSSTPYSEEEADFLVELGVPYIKIASMELNHLAFLKYIAAKGLPMILSTGMGEMEEIEEAVAAIEASGNKQLILLHCVSIYPAQEETVQLNNIIGLRKKFPNYPVGFSDHTLGTAVSIAATALGAAVIEKHFTLSKKAVGMDVRMAAEPKELQKLVQGCRTVWKALGSEERIVLPEEYEQRKNMRRSIVAAREISPGEVITGKDIGCKRPGIGIQPTDAGLVIGKKAVRRIEADTVIQLKDLQ